MGSGRQVEARWELETLTVEVKGIDPVLGSLSLSAQPAQAAEHASKKKADPRQPFPYRQRHEEICRPSPTV